MPRRKQKAAPLPGSGAEATLSNCTLRDETEVDYIYSREDQNWKKYPALFTTPSPVLITAKDRLSIQEQPRIINQRFHRRKFEIIEGERMSAFRLFAGIASLLRSRKLARQLGFSIADIGELLQKWQSPQRDNAEVRALTSRHVAALRRRVDEIQAMIHTLEGLALACEHNGPHNCVILDALDSGEDSPAGCCDFHHFGQPEGDH